MQTTGGRARQCERAADRQAGGLAAYLHADYYADYFASRGITGTFLVMPISGYFLDAASLATGGRQYGAQMAVIHALSNASTNAACGYARSCGSGRTPRWRLPSARR
jgi:hypothetical protein